MENLLQERKELGRRLEQVEADLRALDWGKRQAVASPAAPSEPAAVDYAELDNPDRLAAWLKQQKMSASALGKALRVTESLPYQWLKRKCQPAPDIRAKLDHLTGGVVPAGGWKLIERANARPVPVAVPVAAPEEVLDNPALLREADVRPSELGRAVGVTGDLVRAWLRRASQPRTELHAGIEAFTGGRVPASGWTRVRGVGKRARAATKPDDGDAAPAEEPAAPAERSDSEPPPSGPARTRRSFYEFQDRVIEDEPLLTMEARARVWKEIAADPTGDATLVFADAKTPAEWLARMREAVPLEVHVPVKARVPDPKQQAKMRGHKSGW